MQVKLDETNWANLRELPELRSADRRAVNKKIVFEGDPLSGRPIIRASMDDDIADAVLEHVVENWSLQMPLPSQDPYRPAVMSADGKKVVARENPGSLSKLTLEQDDNLREAIKPYVEALTGQNAPAPENEVPTPPSAS